MDIHIQAFELALGRGVTMPQFFNHVAATMSVPVDNRYLYVARRNGWWEGLLLTSRNIKAFSRMRREHGRILLSPENLGDSELAHFNYFIVREDSCRGLFQHYHGAASLNGLEHQVRQRYIALKKALIAEACEGVGASPTDPPASILRRFAGSISLSIVLRRTTFDALVRELREIRNVAIQFTEYMPSNRAFRPLAMKARAVRHSLTFKAQYRGAVRADLISLVRGGTVKDLRGVGVGDDGLERSFHLLNEPETLGRFDFNDVVLNTNFDSNNVSSSLSGAPMINRLHEVAAEDQWCQGGA